MSEPRSPGDEVESLSLNLAVLGASAGGVEALIKVVETLPPSGDFALVVLTHLNPDGDSQLAEVIGHKAPWPVRELIHGEGLQAGVIHVLRPESVATYLGGRVRLTPRAPGSFHVIDSFLASAAREDAASVAVAILSGTGDDGSMGTVEVRAAGGFIVAQDPASAAHGGMPQSVIDAAVADAVLPPEEIIPAFQRYFAGTPGAGEAEPVSQIAAEAMDLIHQELKQDLRFYKDVNVRRRLLRRAYLQAQGDLGAYLQQLRSDREELSRLRDDLLIGVTMFFRDLELVSALDQRILPELLERTGETIRIWVPACSTGEEAYTIAMLVHRTLQTAGITRKVQIFGSDINERSIVQARSGRYDEAAIESVPEPYRSRYFMVDEGSWRVVKEIRELCVFAAHNLFTNAPFSNVDLVSCRNLLIYLRKPAKRHAFEVCFYALRKRGYLLLGASENADAELFEDEAPSLNLYRRRQITRSPLRGFSMPDLIQPGVTPSRSEAGANWLENMADRVALAKYAPPGFVVDAHGRVIQFRGDTSSLLLPTTGDATLSLARLVRPEMQVDMRTALMEAVRSKLPVRRERVRLGDDHCTIDVVPIPAGGSESYFLVSVQACAPANAPSPAASTDARTEDLERYVRVLGDELEQSRAQLKGLVTEYDATSEELRTANEEVLSANEELQSANEDLQDAKRDLEQANLRLTSLNQQLQTQNQQLQLLNDDLGNLIRGIPAPVLLVDREKCVRHCSPSAAELFGLSPEDFGKPLRENEVFGADVIEEAMSVALTELRPLTLEVRDLSGHWYALSTRAYQTSDNRIDGAVLVFQSIHNLKLALDAANAATTEAERANAAKNDFLALVSHELRSPLNIISNWAEILRLKLAGEGSVEDAQVGGGIKSIVQGCRDLAELIDELLDVSRITSGRLVLDLRPTDLAGVVRSTLEGMAPQAQAKGLEIAASGYNRELLVAGDVRRLQQIVSNILGNALKFTPGGGHIDVALARIDGNAELTITDTGAGIAAEDLPHIFERFSQSDISRTRQYGGLGLGLTIVKSLTEAHGGSVAAASDGVGKGASFVVRIPLSPLEAVRAPDVARQASALSLKGISILLVDDETAGSLPLSHLLAGQGAEVVLAASATEALQRLEERRFDALVGDIAMPQVDGYELMRRIRESESRKGQGSIYAVALTGFTGFADRNAALAAGYDAHFGKPANPRDLAARIYSGVRALQAGRRG